MITTPIYKCIKFNSIKILRDIKYIFELSNIEHNKHIILLGEEHTLQKNCPNSSNTVELIKQSIEFNQEKIIDIFLEEGFPKDKSVKQFTSKGIPTSPLGEVNLFLQDCLSKSKINCQYKNIRAHYTDIRTNLFYGYNYIYLLYMISYEIYDIFYYKIKKYDNLIYINKMLNFLFHSIKKYIESKEKDENVILLEEEIKSFFDDDPFKVRKQIKNIKDESLRKILNDYYTELQKFLTIGRIYIVLKDIDYVIKNKNLENYNFAELYNKLRDKSVFNLIARIVDIYTISRMFRTFSDNSSPRYIIFLYGSAHIKRIFELLKEKLNFSISLREQNMIDNCLDISKLKQPLFYNI